MDNLLVRQTISDLLEIADRVRFDIPYEEKQRRIKAGEELVAWIIAMDSRAA